MALALSRQMRPGSTRTLHSGEDGSVIKRTVLPGGVRVVTEHVPGAHSVALGVWVGVGSRDETSNSAGATHFLEHLLFKGTKRRTPFEISAAIENVGGDLNAFTSKDCTCFHARVLERDCELAVDVLLDMVTSSTISNKEYESERPVVLEEIAMYEDDPGDVAQQAFAKRMFSGSPLADPILGTVATISEMNRRTVVSHYRKHYAPHKIVITAAGAVNHTKMVRYVKKQIGEWAKSSTEEPMPPRALNARRRRVATETGSFVINRPTEQAHLVLGVPGFEINDDRFWSLSVLDTAIGSGMSSRLFQEVREKRGLVYSVQSFRSLFTDTGAFGVYAGTRPEKAQQTVAVIREVLRDVLTEGLSEKEVESAKSQLRGASILATEDAQARMGRLGRSELITGELLLPEDVHSFIDSVSLESVNQVARDLLNQELTVIAVGPFGKKITFDSSPVAKDLVGSDPQ